MTEKTPEPSPRANLRNWVSRSGHDAMLACHALFAPILLLYSSQVVALQHPGEAAHWLAEHPAAVGTTWILLVTCLLLLRALLRKAWLAFLMTSLPVMTLTLVSYYKTLFNGMPLTLSDLAMAKDLFEIAAYTGGKLEITWQTVLAIGLPLCWLALAIYLEHFHSQRPRSSRLLATFGVPLATAFLLMPVILFPLRASAAMSGQTLPTQAERNASYGYVWGLFVAFSSNEDTIPEVVSDAQQASMEAVLQRQPAASEDPKTTNGSTAAAAPAQPQRPSIVFLMSESFFDVTKLPNITFSEDPLPNFHRLSEDSTNGGFLSNTYSGGTGNVEMEMFTGISGIMLKESETLTSLGSSERYRNLPSMVKLLREAGYRTTAIHAHTNRLFERSISFPAIGFEQVLFSDSFPEDVEMEGGYVSDRALAREMIRLFEARSPDEPFFLYALSMENHQPYAADKFADPMELTITSSILPQEDLGVLSALVHGLMDADRSLGFLLDYFESQDEPVIFVFCGDHLPGLYLSKEETVYSKTGYASTAQTLDWSPDELKKMLTTNYAIWTNTDIPLWNDRDESCMLLGLNILNLANIPLSGFFQWIDGHLADEMLMQRPRLFVDNAGVATSEPPVSLVEDLETYNLLIHQILYAQPDAPSAP